MGRERGQGIVEIGLWLAAGAVVLGVGVFAVRWANARSDNALTPKEQAFVQALATRQADDYIAAVATQQAEAASAAPPQSAPAQASAPQPSPPAAPPAPSAPPPAPAAPSPTTAPALAPPQNNVPPPASPPPPTVAPPPAVAPPTDADLYWVFTRVGVSSGPFFYGEFENLNAHWAVCDLNYFVEFSWQRTNGDILSNKSKTQTISHISSLEVASFTILPDGEGHPSVLVDYRIQASWSWC